MVSKPWTWLTAVAVSFAGLTNAHSHVHYCFDGQEPPASVHLVDSAHHTDDAPCHDADACQHVDVDVPNQGFAKVCGHDLPAIALGLVLTTTFQSLAGGSPAVSRDISPAPDPRYTHPQLRAPPH